MAQMLKLHGVEQVVQNLKSSETKIVRSAVRGLVKGGRYLQRESQKIVPVDEGNLRGSAFTRKLGSGKYTDVIVGYTAAYAVYVHENLEAKHGREFNEAYGKIYKRGKRKGQRQKLRGENQQAKFLEKPAREKRNEILSIIFSET